MASEQVLDLHKTDQQAQRMLKQVILRACSGKPRTCTQDGMAMPTLHDLTARAHPKEGSRKGIGAAWKARVRSEV